LPKNEDGEFELILGNRQLLSVFFIVVILLGVFFTMGYIVGRNSTPLGSTEVATAHKPEGKPIVVDSAATHDTPAAQASTPTETAAQLPPAEVPKQETKSERRKETAKAEPPKQASVESQPATGQSYLQLAATSEREADILVDVLRKKGFKAMAAEVPEKKGMFRVLVGPLADGNLNKTKSDLQAAGFPGEKAIKRTF
jgi:cell division septation protein DedD